MDPQKFKPVFTGQMHIFLSLFLQKNCVFLSLHNRVLRRLFRSEKVLISDNQEISVRSVVVGKCGPSGPNHNSHVKCQVSSNFKILEDLGHVLLVLLLQCLVSATCTRESENIIVDRWVNISRESSYHFPPLVFWLT